ncbi:5-methylthioribose kinase [Fistulifera solaris]|uniref:Methylthioribose-1-phosphate isomerase n=1 Tax=Fistulifera solaris TaxID=1519565 RepID=A0A1Z5KNY9_FISSO|nr:5-methylthioribose kinase [Fistulifera solaris]|eukprot:GAX28050.1 5-methylthioribose kinase [Fistulifera solaris]
MTDESTELLRSLVYEPGTPPTLHVLDQLLLPGQRVYIPINDVQAAWTAIRDMQIRGAPLIAIVAVLGLAVDLQTTGELDSLNENDATALLALLETKLDYLLTSRPTAVNLFNAVQEVRDVCHRMVLEDDTNTTARQRLLQAVTQHAEFMLERDVQDNQTLSKYGAHELLSKYSSEEQLTLMTICNTGSLATALYGTALGIVRAVRDQHRLAKIIALETRPYNQGSRLTAFELQAEQMPGATLIADSMAAFYCQRHTVHGIVVGADRVCANGDTANKIGTYQLALVARAHQIPFYVAAPFTTLDVTTSTGQECVIEERPAHEFVQTSQAPADMNVWNPAFDITPAPYITGIVTEKGVLHPQANGTFDVRRFVESYGTVAAAAPSNTQDYTEQTVHTLPLYLTQHAPAAMEILEAVEPEDLDCVEVGDGNLNLVFIVTNKYKPENQVIVKQSLPYVRCVGESWPLTLDRAYYEYQALAAQKAACPEFVPSLYHFSKPNGLIVMEYLKPPHIILRKGLIQGIRYPTMAVDMGTFCGKTLFLTSGFALSTTELRAKVEMWSANSEMCALTEQVVFTDPYMEATNNRWTSPQLDDEKKAIEDDIELKHAAAHYKHKFVGSTQALIHADLHSGSVMCAPSPQATYVIDPEFAFYGPMGFDTGAFVANLFLAYVAQPGHPHRGTDYAEWILEQIATFYAAFERQFLELWNDPTAHTGFVYGRNTLHSPEAVARAQQSFMKDLLADTLGFAGMKMLRRIVGIAHVEDLESIEDADVRAQCEKHGLALAKTFIKTAPLISSMDEAIQLARSFKK